MKKNILLRKALVSVVACSTVLASTAFAQEVAENKLISAATDSSEENLNEENIEERFVNFSGTISEVTKEKDRVRVMIGEWGEDGGLIAHLDLNTTVIDAGSPVGEEKNVADLKEGMKVTFLVPYNSPMAMSNPPQTSSVELIIINSETGNYEISVFDEDLVNKENTLKLNISEETKIISLSGEEKEVTQEDVKNSQCAVFYTASTRSIPAQTTPSLIVILDNEEEKLVEEEKAEFIGLRDEMEGLGFSVEWLSNDSPVVIEKDGVKLEVKLGESEYSLNGEVKKLSLSTKLEDGKMFVSNEIVKELN